MIPISAGGPAGFSTFANTLLTLCLVLQIFKNIHFKLFIVQQIFMNIVITLCLVFINSQEYSFHPLSRLMSINFNCVSSYKYSRILILLCVSSYRYSRRSLISKQKNVSYLRLGKLWPIFEEKNVSDAWRSSRNFGANSPKVLSKSFYPQN